jgi:UDPglucose--hexose-1-phosphate uridylyltransferase
MSQPEISSVIVILQEEFLRLSSVEGIQNVLIFENKGEEVGVSNHHPHGQIYATDFVPRVLLTEYSEARHHMELKGTCVFCDVLSEELKSRQRIVCQNKHFVAYVPYFARYPYEVHIIPRRHLPRIVDLTEEEQEYLAGIYLEVLVRYDNLFEISFPNITVFHNAPCGREYPVSPFHFHIEFCPPLRGPGVLKYMAGFETGAGNIVNPVRPEEAAASLRALSTVHYKVKEG